jgi:hypothetical protein
VIIDDLLQSSPEIDFLVRFAAHHYQIYVLIVTQTCLSSSLYSLVRSAHYLVLIFGSTATTRLAQHLVQTYFLCSETKAYLKQIFSLAERHHDTLLLKINGVASYRPNAHVLALSRVQGLFEEDPPYCYLYPELGRAENLFAQPGSSHLAAADANADADADAATKMSAQAELPNFAGEYLENEAFVLLPASRVRLVKAGAAEGHNPDDSDADADADADANLAEAAKNPAALRCLREKKKHWDSMCLLLEREIEQCFPVKRWTAAKNLARELLRCHQLTVSPDHRTVSLTNKPKIKFSIVDFLQCASRKPGPAEALSKTIQSFKPLVDVLLRHNLPESFVVNKLLLSRASGPRNSRRMRRNRGQARHRNKHRHRNTWYSSENYETQRRAFPPPRPLSPPFYPPRRSYRDFSGAAAGRDFYPY